MQTMTFSVSPVPPVYTQQLLIWKSLSDFLLRQKRTDGTKFTWCDYTNKIIQMIMKRHKNVNKMICLNDNYSSPTSIKDSEHILRQTNKEIGNVFMKTELAFPNTLEFNDMLSKSANKIRLQDFLKSQIQKIVNVTTTEIIFCRWKVSRKHFKTNTRRIFNVQTCRS